MSLMVLVWRVERMAPLECRGVRGRATMLCMGARYQGLMRTVEGTLLEVEAGGREEVVVVVEEVHSRGLSATGAHMPLIARALCRWLQMVVNAHT